MGSEATDPQNRTSHAAAHLPPGGAPQIVKDTLAGSEVLRAVINLGNPVLAQGTPQEPRGVTVAIARELAAWLDVRLEMTPVLAARDAYAALTAGEVDVCFLAIEPVREEGAVFTAPYALIAGVYIVRSRRRGEVAESRVPSTRVVERLQVVEDRELGLASSGEPAAGLPVEQLALQRGEHALGQGVEAPIAVKQHEGGSTRCS